MLEAGLSSCTRLREFLLLLLKDNATCASYSYCHVAVADTDAAPWSGTQVLKLKHQLNFVWRKIIGGFALRPSEASFFRNVNS
jgi:hypothetical protein